MSRPGSPHSREGSRLRRNRTARALPEREKRVRRRAAIIAALTLAAFTTACAGAQAKTIQLGSPLTRSFALVVLGPPATYVQGLLPEPGANVASPVDGTVISYRVASADGTFAIQIVRLEPDFLGQSTASSAGALTNSAGVSPPIATHLAIKAGDSVGIRNFDGGSDQLGMSYPGSGYNHAWFAYWDPPLAVALPSDP